jgi:hypothetical protein
MTQEEIKKRAQEIEKIYQEYIGKLKMLKNEQDKILQEFISELEKRKLDEIRAEIKSQ